jgi:hypothetical protein
MLPPMQELSVEVEGTHIAVRMPGTDFWLTYQKEAGSPQLVRPEAGSSYTSHRLP